MFTSLLIVRSLTVVIFLSRNGWQFCQVFKTFHISEKDPRNVTIIFQLSYFRNIQKLRYVITFFVIQLRIYLSHQCNYTLMYFWFRIFFNSSLCVYFPIKQFELPTLDEPFDLGLINAKRFYKCSICVKRFMQNTSKISRSSPICLH